MSHHFNVLKAADLIRSERRGQQIVYSLNTTVLQDVVTLLLDLFPQRGVVRRRGART
jgi:DNA-binding transcriptional ArsR family regulator